MIGSFASGPISPWRPKMELKRNIPPLWIRSSKKPQFKKFDKTDPPKSGNCNSKYNFEIFKNQKSNSKKAPKSSKKSKTYIRRPQIKKFYKTDLTKSGISYSKYNFEPFKNQKSNSKKTP